MDFTSASGNVGGQFTDGDPGAGQAATIVDSVWLNGVQNELVRLIEESGQVATDANWTQIREAIRRWNSSENQIFNANLSLSKGSNIVFPLAAGVVEVAAGWTMTTDGAVSITRASQDSSGWLIEGSGNIGDTIELKQSYNTYRAQNAAANITTSPQPKKIYTGAIRAFTLSTDSSIAVTMSARPPSVSSIFTITELDNDTAEIGGVANVQGLASVRYELENKFDQSAASVPNGPEFVFTLGDSGTFAIRINGAGLWEGHVPGAWIPSAIISDYVRDSAFYAANYKDKYNLDVTYNSVQGIADVSVSLVDSNITVNVPLPDRLGFDATFPEMLVSSVGGTVDGNAITAVDSAVIETNTAELGANMIAIAFSVDHSAVGDANWKFAVLNFRIQIQQGQDFT